MKDLLRQTNNRIPLDHQTTHAIDIPYDTEPIRQKTRGIPYNFREEFRRTILEMKEAGMIVDSKSPWSSPV